MKKAIVIMAAVIAVAALPQGVVFGQSGQQGAMLPPWVDDGWRNSQYPPSEWYVGYSVDAVRAGAKLSDVQKRVEKEAQLKLAEGISVRIQSVSSTHTSSVRTTDGKNANETVKKDYGQRILASTDAEVAKVELTTFYDQANNKVYALAKVRKTDLANYYVSRIDFYHQNAENDLKLARQFADSDKKRSAVEKVADAMKNINECGKYTELLSAVDYKDTKRLIDKGAAILRDIAAFETKVQESTSVFVGGTEILNDKEVSIVIPGIQSMLSESGCRVADKRDESNFVLTVNVRDCEKNQSGSFFYVNACVKADIYNVKTARSDAKLNFTAPKAGWTNEEKAAKKAFEEAAAELWKQLREKTEICK